MNFIRTYFPFKIPSNLLARHTFELKQLTLYDYEKI